MSNCVTETISASRHRWEEILLQLGIDLPGLNKHGPCPCCGGKDRFRFDDKDGRGTWFCNQCGNGDGLDLIAKVKKCNPLQATKLISELSLPCQTAPAREKVSKPCASIEAMRLLNSSRLASSPYLKNKGLSASVQMLSIQKALTIGGASFDNDSIVLPIQDIDGMLISAQLINAAGEKRYLPGTRQNGGFIKVGDSSNTANIIITEGYATALTVNLATGHLALAAMSANNLLNIAVTARHKYPNSSIIIAAENDSIEANNVGLVQAEKAAVTVNGWISLPPDENVSDWDDYRQLHNESAVNEAFHLQMYQPGSQLSSISRIQERKPDLSTSLPLRKGSDGFDTRQDYLIKGYLPSASVTSAYGASGSYKSFLAVSWGCHIATGKPWAGRPVTQGAVIYVVGEGGIGVPRRIRAWEETLNNGSPIDTLYRIDCPIFPASSESVQQVIRAANDVKAASGMPVRLIILDTLARCFGGSDENAAKDMGAFIQGCDVIKAATEATVLVIHHSGKDQDKGARGSSAFRAALDVEFNVRREGEGDALILSCTKMKDAEEPPRRAYDLVPVDLYIDNDGDQISSLVLNDEGRPVMDDTDPELTGITRLTDNHVALWQAIRSRTANGDACTRALVRDDMRAMGFDVSKKFTRWLDKLEKEGRVICDGEHIRPVSLEYKAGE